MNQIGKHGSHYGILYGIAAYASWGIIPLYFKAVASVPPVEVLAHRALWSFVMLAVLVGLLGRWKELWRELRSRKLLLMLTLSTLFIAANWLTFIYAVTSGQVLQASLGYFINPLVNVLLGVVFLRERLRTRQTLSIGLALIGVLVLTLLVGAGTVDRPGAGLDLFLVRPDAQTHAGGRAGEPHGRNADHGPGGPGLPGLPCGSDSS